jgi:predicted MFS family arabinose efflux permease
MASKGTLSSLRRSAEPWYAAYTLFIAVIGGIAPILLPQQVILAEDSPVHVGLVVSAIGLGGLTSVVWSGLADRFGWHRGLFAGGLLACGVALAGFPVAPGVPGWVGLALVLGTGASAANTMANLLILETHPTDEWDTRIGWLQTFYNVGTVAGFLLAGVFSHLPLAGSLELEVGLLTGAAMVALAALLAWLTTRAPPRRSVPATVKPRPTLHSLWMMHHAPRFHQPSLKSLRWLPSILRSPFGLVLVVWLVSNIGPNGLSALYPVMMLDAFGMSPGTASFAQALAYGVGIALYTPAALLVHRGGGLSVLQAGLAIRVAALLALMALGAAAIVGREWLAVLSFAAITLAWPLLSVSSTVLVSKLSPVGAGEGMGIYNTTAQLAGLLGPLVGGYVAHAAGYSALSGLAAAGVVLSVLLTLPLLRSDATRPSASK